MIRVTRHDTGAVLPPPFLLGMPDRYQEWRPRQDHATDLITTFDGRFLALVAPTGSGKCHGKDTPILMFDGTVKMVQDVDVGDWVMGPDSKPREVLGTTSGHGKLYQVQPVKGDPYTVNRHHILSLQHTVTGSVHNLSVKNYLKSSKTFKHVYKGYRKGVRFNSVPVPLDPYFLGLWLGDGSEGGAAITTADVEVHNYLYLVASDFDLNIRNAEKKGNKATCVFLTQGKGCGSSTNPIVQHLRAMGICHNKRVPHIYKVNDEKSRLLLLAGYIDADGSYSKGVYDIVSKSERLMDDIVFVARSLGFAASSPKGCYKETGEGVGGVYYRSCISGDVGRIPVKVERKKAEPRRQKKSVLRTGIKVVDIGDGEYYGFETDGDHLYLLGDFTVTHNSLSYMTAGMLIGGRTLILTSTNALTDQLMEDFGGLCTHIRGKSHYRCRKIGHGVMCDKGPCNFGVACSWKDGGCEYYDKVGEAQAARIVVTNYAFWIYNNKARMESEEGGGDFIGGFDLMVCDEAHDCPDRVADAFTVRFSTRNEVERYLLQSYGWGEDEGPQYKQVAGWAREALREVKRVYQEAKEGHQTERTFQAANAKRKLTETIRMVNEGGPDGNVIVVPERKWGTLRVAVAWPFDRAEDVLFADIPKVVFTSATVRGKTLKMLGIEDDAEVVEYPHIIPLSRRMLYHIPTIRLNFRTTPVELRTWLTRIDQIIRSRQEIRGIIHTVSYARRNEIIKRSKYSHLMVSHNREDASQVIEDFKSGLTPPILVSPSVTTGYDFPEDTARWQIIGKIAYPDTSDPITKERCNRDSEYAPYVAMQTLVQTVGRIVRGEEDWGESMVIDDNVTWFLRKYSEFAPEWFRGSFKGLGSVPHYNGE